MAYYQGHGTSSGDTQIVHALECLISDNAVLREVPHEFVHEWKTPKWTKADSIIVHLIRRVLQDLGCQTNLWHQTPKAQNGLYPQDSRWKSDLGCTPPFSHIGPSLLLLLQQQAVGIAIGGGDHRYTTGTQPHTPKRNVKINKVLVDADGLLLCSVTLLSEACGSSAAMQIWKYMPSKTGWHHQVQMEGSKKSGHRSWSFQNGIAGCKYFKLPSSIYRLDVTAMLLAYPLVAFLDACGYEWRYIMQMTCFLARDEWKWSHFAIIPAHWWILDDYLIIAALTYTNWPSKCTGIKDWCLIKLTKSNCTNDIQW